MKKKILLCVTGSIAAYKATDLVNRLKSDYDITVAMTKSATEFITPLTLSTLSNQQVYTDMFDPSTTKVDHIDLVKNCDLILVAPVTANTITKMALGLADDLISTMLVVGHNKPTIIAPAMNENMYINPIIQSHIQILKNRGVKVVEPRTTLLACGDYGKGALAEVLDIKKSVIEVLER